MLYFKLDKIMDKRNLSINKVSSETKISRPALTAMYNNESKGVQFETLEKLMDYFNVSLDQLIGEREDQTIFTFKNLIIEQIKNKKNKEGFLVGVEGSDKDFEPGEAMVFEGNISLKGIHTDTFSFVITPISSNDETNKIISLATLFYRNEKKQDLTDIIAFINELNNESLTKFLKGILDSWYRVYKLIDKSISLKAPTLENGLILVSLDTIDKKLNSIFPVEVKTSIANEKYFSFGLVSQIERPDSNDRVNKDFVIREID